MILKDKYFLLCLITCFVLISFSFSYTENEEDENNTIIGLITEVSETSNGYVFVFEKSDGMLIDCYSKNKLDLNEIYQISGSYSSDKTLFFISEFVKCQT